MQNTLYKNEYANQKVEPIPTRLDGILYSAVLFAVVLTIITIHLMSGGL